MMNEDLQVYEIGLSVAHDGEEVDAWRSIDSIDVLSSDGVFSLDVETRRGEFGILLSNSAQTGSAKFVVKGFR